MKKFCTNLHFLNKTVLSPHLGHFKRPVTCTASLSKKAFDRPGVKFSKPSKNNENEQEDGASSVDVSFDTTEEAEYNQLVERAFRIPSSGHNVFVIQPYIKWGVEKKRNITPQLQLDEACALIRTLRNWTVADKLTVPLLTLDRTSVFGKGTLEKLQKTVEDDQNISAVFVSIDILKTVQREFLEKSFRVQVYDRYSIVLQIFREHAVSREAKLQLRLAELPYLRGRLNYLSPSSKSFSSKSGESFTEFQRGLLKERERRIKSEIDSLRSQRDLLRKKRRKSDLPIIAVVGYTNCGKTSLIKALTHEEAITPKNELFATLDVTVHAGVLPSGMKALFVDTIGFISDIPTTLLESFVATLEDALLADVIVHVRDISHPAFTSQIQHVEETLRNLNLDDNLMGNIINVNNKIDLVDGEVEKDDAISTSATRLKGIEELRYAVEGAILRTTGRQRLEIRIQTGGEEYQWLRRECTVVSLRADENDAQYCFMHVIIAPHVLSKFKHDFISNRR